MRHLRHGLTRLIGVFLTATACGCATAPAPDMTPPPPAPMPAAPPPPPPVVAPVSPPPAEGAKEEPAALKQRLYGIWYATNRTPIISKGEVVDYSAKWDKQVVHYGKIYAEIPDDFLKKISNRGWFEKLFPTSEAQLRLSKPVELASQAFVDQLRSNLKDAQPGEKDVLIYLHGFNTSFKEAAQRAASIGYQLKIPTTAFFSWPSQGGLKKYLADKDLAELSEDCIADFIIKAYSELGATRIHLIAHSMGNYALLGAMYRPKMQQAIQGGLRFGQVILAAPDVETEKFAKDAGILSGISERVSLYVSDGDRALLASKTVAGGMPRAGLRPPVVVVKNIDTVDVSSTNLTALGHAFVSEEISVLNDMHSLILHNDPPANRINIVKKDNYWLLQ